MIGGKEKFNSPKYWNMYEVLSIDQECIFHHEEVIRLYISKLRASLGKE